MALLDSQGLIWFDAGDPRMNPSTRRKIETFSRKGELMFGLGSVWEIAIKHGNGNLALPEPVDAWIGRCLREMRIRVHPVRLEHALAVARLPSIHRDPFDRILIAQAILDDLPVITGDAEFHEYGVRVIW